MFLGCLNGAAEVPINLGYGTASSGDWCPPCMDISTCHSPSDAASHPRTTESSPQLRSDFCPSFSKL